MKALRLVIMVATMLIVPRSAPALNGCAPESKDASKCEAGIAKAIGKLVGGVMKCHTKQAAAALKGTPADDEDCESGSSSAKAKLDAAIAKVAPLCPASVTANAATLEADLLDGETSLDALNGQLYCDPTSGTMIDGSGDDLGFVPASSAAGKCASGVGKALAKLWAGAAKCNAKAAAVALKGKSFDEVACRKAATDKYDAGSAKVLSGEGCPSCLGASAQQSLRDAIVARVDDADGLIFVCPTGTTSTSTTLGGTSSTTLGSTSTTTPTTTSSTTTTLAQQLACPAGGQVNVVTTLVPNSQTFNSNLIEGIEVDLGYPSAVSMPGTGFLPVNDPADPTTLIALLSAGPTGINLYDGNTTFFDADTPPPAVLRTILSLNPTANLIFAQPVPFERARFTCTPGINVSASSFQCTIPSEVDLLARPIPPEQRPACSVGLAP